MSEPKYLKGLKWLLQSTFSPNNEGGKCLCEGRNGTEQGLMALRPGLCPYTGAGTGRDLDISPVPLNKPRSATSSIHLLPQAGRGADSLPVLDSRCVAVPGMLSPSRALGSGELLITAARPWGQPELLHPLQHPAASPGDVTPSPCGYNPLQTQSVI